MLNHLNRITIACFSSCFSNLRIQTMFLIIAILGLSMGLSAKAETTITYQGQLQDGAGSVTGSPDMAFRLYDSLIDGNQVGPDIVKPEVPVTDGLFQVELDFGAVYDGQRWLEVEVAGTILDPRQPITSTPVAVRALTVPATSLEGDFWRLGGNAGASPEAFIGTTDNSPFEIRVDGDHAMRFQPGSLGDTNIIGGHDNNHVADGVRGATISGGGASGIKPGNVITDNWGSIGGGGGNRVEGSYSTVGGGVDNLASGGLGSRQAATVAGGKRNMATSNHSTVAGGRDNTASGTHSMVPGGLLNEAAGAGSFAAGRRAKAEHVGTFVWADYISADFVSTGMGQFLIRAGGGVGVNTNAPSRELHIAQQTTAASAVGLALENTDGNEWGVYVAVSDNLGLRFNDDLVARINSSDGEFVPLSDARSKDEIEPVSGALDHVLQLQPSTYFMKSDSDRERRSVGLIAQEVKTVFPSAVSKVEDVYGVSYNQITVLNTAAIIELNAHIQQELDIQHEANKLLQAQVTELQMLLEDSRAELSRERVEADELNERLSRLEAVLLKEGQWAARD